MKRIITLALVICAVGMAARGQNVSSQTGNSIYEACLSELGGYKSGRCIGYIDGFTDGIAIGQLGVSTAICLPVEATTGQIRDVLKRTLKEAPETRHMQAYRLVAAALKKAWPCK